ncbi:putative short chain dehydrogenase/reductase [Thozetella sp. PMI_491]|nr:putative short chain dehydrogenase/reductase [Thozetella sp. PMI_491]
MASDKTIVLITGSNSGIGLETVVALAQASDNYHVLLCARSLEKGRDALRDIQSMYGDSLKGAISILQLDLTSRESIHAAKDEVEKTYGKLDVLVNNAAVILSPSMDLLERLRLTFETNLFGPYYLTQLLEPLLKKSATPLVVNVSSDLGSITLKLDPKTSNASTPGEPYRASKAALNMISACQRYSYKEWGCRVCSFNPGYCVSNLTGPKGREVRIATGAKPARFAADALTDIVQGKRDADFDKNGMMDAEGDLKPW